MTDKTLAHLSLLSAVALAGLSYFAWFNGRVSIALMFGLVAVYALGMGVVCRVELYLAETEDRSKS